MKRLFLLRHAKAGPHRPDDHGRELIARGRQDAARLGHFLREEGLAPDLVLSSDSARTMQTVKCLLPELAAPPPPVKYLRELYLAEPEPILALARRAPAACASLMIVGHNPGIEQCATALRRPPQQKKFRKHYVAMEEKFPTCALAVIDFPVTQWGAVAPGLGELIAFVRPKDMAPPD